MNSVKKLVYYLTGLQAACLSSLSSESNHHCVKREREQSMKLQTSCTSALQESRKFLFDKNFWAAHPITVTQFCSKPYIKSFRRTGTKKRAENQKVFYNLLDIVLIPNFREETINYNLNLQNQFIIYLLEQWMHEKVNIVHVVSSGKKRTMLAQDCNIGMHCVLVIRVGHFSGFAPLHNFRKICFKIYLKES